MYILTTRPPAAVFTSPTASAALALALAFHPPHPSASPLALVDLARPAIPAPEAHINLACQRTVSVMLTTASSHRKPHACYFTIRPPSYNHHFSTETPSFSPTSPDFSPVTSPQTEADPTHPLLAHRQQDTQTSLSAASDAFLKMQTVAAHGHVRPRPSPVQNVLHVTSSDSSSAHDASSDSSDMSSFHLARCSRCQRTPSCDIKSGDSNMIQYGLNLWYCRRCASLVGLNR